MDFRKKILETAKKKILFTLHAVDQMNKPERMISEEEVKSILLEGEVVEEYPDDPRGPSCLMGGWFKGQRPLHVVCSPKESYLAVITAYIPDPQEWDKDFKIRRR